MQELKNLAKDPQDFGISFGSNKISSEKKGESECSYDLSSDEENKSQNKKGKLKIVDEDKFLSDLKKENERLEKELTNITHPQIRESINLPISAERPQTSQVHSSLQQYTKQDKSENASPMCNEKMGVPSTSPNYRMKERNSSPNFIKGKIDSSYNKMSVQTAKDGGRCTSCMSMANNEKCKAMELRIMGAVNTIHRLESLIKKKEDTIKRQQEDISTKAKQINKLQSSKESVSSVQKNAQIQYNLAMSLKKKEKEMQDRLLEYENKIQEFENKITNLQQESSSQSAQLQEKDQVIQKQDAQINKLNMKCKEDDISLSNYKAELDRVHKNNKQCMAQTEFLQGKLTNTQESYKNFRELVTKLVDYSKDSLNLHQKVVDKLTIAEKSQY